MNKPTAEVQVSPKLRFRLYLEESGLDYCYDLEVVDGDGWRRLDGPLHTLDGPNFDDALETVQDHARVIAAALRVHADDGRQPV